MIDAPSGVLWREPKKFCNFFGSSATRVPPAAMLVATVSRSRKGPNLPDFLCTVARGAP